MYRMFNAVRAFLEHVKPPHIFDTQSRGMQLNIAPLFRIWNEDAALIVVGLKLLCCTKGANARCKSDEYFFVSIENQIVLSHETPHVTESFDNCHRFN